MEVIKLKAISFAKTFVALFVLQICYAISQIPFEQVVSGEVLQGTLIVGLIAAASRSAADLAWEKIMPVKLGGKPKA